MNLAARLSSAGQFVEFLRLQVHEKLIPSTTRVRLAAACLALAQEHHHAIVLLIERRLYGSAFSLIRMAFEAYVRGEWLAHCANDDQVEAFARGEKPPKLGKLTSEVDSALHPGEGKLSDIKAAHWSTMCAYTHSGGLHVQRWQSGAAVEPSYSDGEVLEILKVAEIFGAASAVALLGIAGDEPAIKKVTDVFLKRDEA